MAKGKKTSAKTPLLIGVLVLLIIVFAGLCVFYFGLKHYLGKTNYVDDSEVTINYGLLTADEDDLEGFTEMETLDAEAAAAFAKEVNVGQNIDIASDGDVYNILLIGSDTRDGWYGNSDSMIFYRNKDFIIFRCYFYCNRRVILTEFNRIIQKIIKNLLDFASVRHYIDLFR